MEDIRDINVVITAGSPRVESKSFRLAKHLYHRLCNENFYNVFLLDIREFTLSRFEEVLDDLTLVPNNIKKLAEKFVHADAYILVTPEYNGSYTSVLQNFFEHFPRQEKKIYGIVTATNGSFGGMRASQQLILLIVALFGIVSPYMLITPFVDKKFDVEGNLIDNSFKDKIDFFLDQFTWLVNKMNNDKIR